MSATLEVRGLRTHFETERGIVRAVDGVDISVETGMTLGVVGESGCGKTVLALSLLRLVPFPPGRIVGGSVLLAGRELLSLSEEEMRRVRGREISMIFQEPMTSLNPVFRIGEQIAEVIRLHQGVARREALARSVEMLRKVGIPSPEKRVRDYPHQLSGGMRQRVMIAIALACRPRLMLADEPTTALDVTIQAQMLDVIGRLQSETGCSVILITHDLGVIAEAARDVAVMYAGRIVERSPTRELFASPLHPYTVGLMGSIPRLDGPAGRNALLRVIPGTVPPLYALPAGCPFQDRCPDVFSICREKEPVLKENSIGHSVSCLKYGECT
ncbi:MAG: peptide ABC transporter ATP-binding protein [Syntrophus sp. (in: bacteria)]|nr:peptide ABC transporter ATP-binding protein [Syntrophus sp. (in: bacteria)]